jgi:hypothetical protein
LTAATQRSAAAAELNQWRNTPGEWKQGGVAIVCVSRVRSEFTFAHLAAPGLSLEVFAAMLSSAVTVL